MIAGTDEYLNEASSELFKRLADLAVQEECEAREEYYRERQYMTDLRHEVEEVKNELAKSTEELARSKEDLARNKKDLARNKKDLEKNKKDLERSKKDLEKNKADLEKKDKTINTLNTENVKLRKLLEQNNISISF